ncbi:MAG TPA: hypothetical protein VH061_11755 [Solirubrobacteraceae bacterium]|jgi:hypothetical protein|nr:hypothetical protein [Solirubrobacteraceae bacterium]
MTYLSIPEVLGVTVAMMLAEAGLRRLWRSLGAPKWVNDEAYVTRLLRWGRERR